MKRTAVAVLIFVMLMAMTVPALAAGRTYHSPAGAGAAAGDVSRDQLRDGTGVNCPEECTALQDGTGAQNQSRNATAAAVQSGEQSQLRAQEASGKPESAARNGATPTANAQHVLARNEERIESRVSMPEEIRTKLADLFNRIVERFQLWFGLE